MIRNLAPRIIVSAFAALTFFVVATLSLSAQESFSSEPLTIQTAGGKTHQFTAELATTNNQRQQGLMYRKSMAPTNGMLFDFGTDRKVTMWMRNTLIPLDMLFISKDGKIAHIHENAIPHSEAIISSRGPVRYVLELIGGSAKKFGLNVGDTVQSNQIGNADR